MQIKTSPSGFDDMILLFPFHFVNAGACGRGISKFSRYIRRFRITVGAQAHGHTVQIRICANEHLFQTFIELFENTHGQIRSAERNRFDDLRKV